jgi:tRNA-specific 2-thiouridylase
VLDIEPVTATVTVGPGEALDVTRIVAERPVWSGCAPPEGPLGCLVQLRAHGDVHAATVTPDGDAVRISLAAPARGVAPGQAAVFYRGDAVLGSATITATAA